MNPFPSLPIASLIPELKKVLSGGPNAVLQAPPGAGKTTLVPLALLQEPWLQDRRILLLEPRRLAARAAARRMAEMIGERVGETVGYRTRLDSVVGPKTRIEVLTEGILTRRLQRDPGLDGVGLIVFDEFHERSIHADLGMALSLEVQESVREDLKLLVMSATLEGEAVARLMAGARILTGEGRRFPVEVAYLEREVSLPLEQEASRCVRAALRGDGGDVLVFLPGRSAIRRLEGLLTESRLGPGVRICPLYGDLPQDAQDEAIRPGPAGVRKVVLATSIAETSLTIEGIRVVVDSGLMRVPAFDPRSGMTRLKTARVSRASAEQRCGRAGRLGPGFCYRLWTEETHRHLAERTAPEILSSDLAPLALELAAWGVREPGQLRWLDPPPPAAFSQAQDLLTRLDALDQGGKITPHGRLLSELPLHPRLAHMILKAKELGLGALACDLGALLSERDIVKDSFGTRDADLRERVEILRATGGETRVLSGLAFDAGACRRVVRTASGWKKRLGIPGGEGEDLEKVGILLSFAYPDRIAQRRPGRPNHFLLSNGRGAFLPEGEFLAAHDYVVAAHLDGGEQEARIFLSAPVCWEELEEHLPESTERVELIGWEKRTQSVAARRQLRLGRLVLKDEPLFHPDPVRVASALLEGIRQLGMDVLPWSKEARNLQARMLFLRRVGAGDWPDVSDEALLANLEGLLGPHVYGMKGIKDLQRLDLRGVLLGLLSHPQRRSLEELAPTHVTVPSGSRVPIQYDGKEKPVLSVRLQEMFGASDTPAVAAGRVPLTLHLLSPAGRPVQVTDDLASFWSEAYFQVKKDLKGRYPRHHWPEDPLQAQPTKRAKPKGK